MRNLLLYIVIGVGIVGGIITLAIYAPKIGHAWFSFVGFTILLVGILVKLYWTARKDLRIWMLLLAFLAIHCGFYTVLLRHSSDWPAFWYVLTGPIEVMVFATIAKIGLNILPRRVR
jgi:hypothetical protein